MASNRVYQASLVSVLGVAVFGSTYAISQRDYAFFDPLLEVKDVLNRRYVEKPDDAALQAGAISGLVEALHDPYTAYVPPSDRREFDKGLIGEYVGIGVLVDVRDGWLTVITPMEDSAAYKAGIVADDRIVEIEGKSTERLSTDECVDLLTGKPGSAVGIVIERDGRRIPISITREEVVVRTVKGFHWGDDAAAGAGWQHLIDPARGIGYIRITQFIPATVDEFRQTLDALGAAESKLGGLIVDLRFNPGGVLDGAAAIADLFLREGVIVTTKGRAFPDEVARAAGPGTLPDFPLVVLVNGQSASASEVLAGALAENDRAVIVGSRTFGKGLVQSVVPIPSVPGAQLKVTQQRYYLPSGRSLHRTNDSATWGVDPSPGFYVPLSDEQTREMLEVRRSEDVLRGGGSGDDGTPTKWADPAWIVDRLKDAQLSAALAAVQKRLDGGAWTATGQPLPAGTEAAGRDLARAELLRDRLERELERLDRRIDALQSAIPPGSEPTGPDLWPDAAGIVGGRIVVTDSAGRVVARLRITSPNVEAWLAQAGVEAESTESR